MDERPGMIDSSELLVFLGLATAVGLLMWAGIIWGVVEVVRWLW